MPKNADQIQDSEDEEKMKRIWREICIGFTAWSTAQFKYPANYIFLQLVSMLRIPCCESWHRNLDLSNLPLQAHAGKALSLNKLKYNYEFNKVNIMMRCMSKYMTSQTPRH